MHALYVEFIKAEGSFLKLLLGIAGEQGTALAAQAHGGYNYQPPVLLGELNYLEAFGYLEVQAVKLVYPAKERLLLGLD